MQRIVLKLPPLPSGGGWSCSRNNREKLPVRNRFTKRTPTCSQAGIWFDEHRNEANHPFVRSGCRRCIVWMRDLSSCHISDTTVSARYCICSTNHRHKFSRGYAPGSKGCCAERRLPDLLEWGNQRGRS